MTRTDLYDPAFFADESRSQTALAERFARVLARPWWRLPAADACEWVRNLEALAAGRARPDDRPHVAPALGAVLAEHAAAGVLTSWARSVGLVTVLAAVEGTRAAVGGVEAYIGGAGTDLLGPLAAAVSAYHDEAQGAPAGPLAFFWLMRAAAPFAPHFGPLASADVRAYLAHTPADDCVRRFLLAPPGRDEDVPSRRDGTPGEWAAGLFNGCRTWTRDGLLRGAGLAAAAAAAAAGVAVWAASAAHIDSFRAGQTEPMRSALAK